MKLRQHREIAEAHDEDRKHIAPNEESLDDLDSKDGIHQDLVVDQIIGESEIIKIWREMHDTPVNVKSSRYYRQCSTYRLVRRELRREPSSPCSLPAKNTLSKRLIQLGIGNPPKDRRCRVIL